MNNTSDNLVQRVARAILEADPTYNYDKVKKRVEDDVARGRDLELEWWDHLHDQARAAIVAAQAWQPIETLPESHRDGRKLVMWAPGFGLGALTLYWMDGKWREPKDGAGLKVEPTHWLPIRALPEADA